MKKQPHILIVEDNIQQGKKVARMLKDLNYAVNDIVTTGEEAIEKSVELIPDLVLMDIKLKGEIDGVHAAEHIKTNLNIPVIYLTAYADDDILKRVKMTEPFGYILKPFESRELQTIIEIALYKFQMEQKLKESEQWLSVTLKSISDAVISTDNDGLIKYMNPVAEKLIGQDSKFALGKRMTEVVVIIDKDEHIKTESLISKALGENNSQNESLLISNNGKKIRIGSNAAPMIDERGRIIGALFVFRELK